MAEDEVYKVTLVVRDPPRGVEFGAFLYRGALPEDGQEIDVENERNPDDRRRARVTRITRDYELVIQGPLIHAVELEP